ncbi:MAG: DUF4416 family protein [Planctomycetota bacterium]|jgi:hypothetical protein
MWEITKTKPVKLIIAVMAADEKCLIAALDAIVAEFGATDFESKVWPFDQTDYYKDQAGPHIVKQFVTIDKLIDPGELARIKHTTNQIEQRLAERLNAEGFVWPRPINLDPGIIEPSKLVLASTKNFSHRIYIGEQMYAEVTLVFNKGKWESFPYTFPDYKQDRYHGFFNKVRTRLNEQHRQSRWL